MSCRRCFCFGFFDSFGRFDSFDNFDSFGGTGGHERAGGVGDVISLICERERESEREVYVQTPATSCNSLFAATVLEHVFDC